MRLKTAGCALVACLLAPPSFAAILAPWTPGPGGEDNLYELLASSDITDNTTLNALAVYDVVLDPSVVGDRYSSLLIEHAGNRDFNSFGIYEVGNTANKLEIFAGALNPVVNEFLDIAAGGGGSWDLTVGGPTMNIPAGGKFGFYLERGGSLPTFYSVASLNPNTADQMAAFDVSKTKYGQAPFNTLNAGYVLAWEDLTAGPGPLGYNGDSDYNDVLVTMTAQPIPEPTTVIAGGLLLLPFAASTLRFFRRSIAK